MKSQHPIHERVIRLLGGHVIRLSQMSQLEEKEKERKRDRERRTHPFHDKSSCSMANEDHRSHLSLVVIKHGVQKHASFFIEILGGHRVAIAGIILMLKNSHVGQEVITKTLKPTPFNGLG